MEVKEDIKENIQIEETLQPHEDNADNLADILTSKQLESKISHIVDEKITLAQSALDDEEEEVEEETQESSIGLFPLLLIGGVLLVGGATLLLNNRPTDSETQKEG